MSSGAGGTACQRPSRIAWINQLGSSRNVAPRSEGRTLIWSSPSRHPNMKELRVQHTGRPYRVLFAFDPRRSAILLAGGDKTGNDRWYEEFVPVADRLYDEHLAALKKEKRNNG